jgi:hypothetical protein
MKEAASTSEMSVNFYQTTRRNNPEDSHLYIRRRENLKSYLISQILDTIFTQNKVAKYAYNYFDFKVINTICIPQKICIFRWAQLWANLHLEEGINILLPCLKLFLPKHFTEKIL